MEFSPFHGFSTLTICDALAQVNIHPDFFETHEIDKENARLTNFNLYENNVDFVKVIEGDVFQALDREKLKEVEDTIEEDNLKFIKKEIFYGT